MARYMEVNNESQVDECSNMGVDDDLIYPILEYIQVLFLFRYIP